MKRTITLNDILWALGSIAAGQAFAILVGGTTAVPFAMVTILTAIIFAFLMLVWSEPAE